jgi:hypothetical protein
MAGRVNPFHHLHVFIDSKVPAALLHNFDITVSRSFPVISKITKSEINAEQLHSLAWNNTRRQLSGDKLLDWVERYETWRVSARSF